MLSAPGCGKIFDVLASRFLGVFAPKHREGHGDERLGVNLTRIGRYAFNSCGALTKFTDSDLSSLETIESFAFNSCGALTKFTDSDLPSLETIGISAFESCGALAKFTDSDLSSLETIGVHAFRSCGALTEFTDSDLPSLQSIGASSFCNTQLRVKWRVERVRLRVPCVSTCSIFDECNSAVGRTGMVYGGHVPVEPL